jgi:hypothetical protein
MYDQEGNLYMYGISNFLKVTTAGEVIIVDHMKDKYNNEMRIINTKPYIFELRMGNGKVQLFNDYRNCYLIGDNTVAVRKCGTGDWAIIDCESMKVIRLHEMLDVEELIYKSDTHQYNINEISDDIIIGGPGLPYIKIKKFTKYIVCENYIAINTDYEIIDNPECINYRFREVKKINEVNLLKIENLGRFTKSAR